MRTTWSRVRVGVMLSMLVGAAAAGDPPIQPKDVAQAYFFAIQASDLDAAGALFAKESSIFETGGVEGSWKHYREHHLGPEIDGIASFAIRPKDPQATSSKDGTLALLTWPIEYTIALKDGRTIESRGTVSFVLIREAGTLKIRHLHWSSRRVKP